MSSKPKTLSFPLWFHERLKELADSAGVSESEYVRNQIAPQEVSRTEDLAAYIRRQKTRVAALAKFGVPVTLTAHGDMIMTALAADITIARLTKREQRPRRVRAMGGR